MAQILKEEYRERILNASLAEFFNYGYEDASMRRIAVEAKMSVGNLYHYYRIYFPYASWYSVGVIFCNLLKLEEK